ncbi:site-specific DNA-methyltransferase [Microbacterium enclense]|uniref:site-specific DNA-methyltransferase n=1 Tax=Microbacterium enclense TaxID=993073 RepID=UPI00203C431E|nr:DNA methyltransferase [Microbacterium enclense]MCM3615749.1 site-specific DNA-methyltransferase [Microbacterium enclense]
MSRLSDLLRAAGQLDPQLAKDLEEEIQPLQKRLRFGLNFERHAPEAVELAGHKIRKGSKVRMLPPRGSSLRGDRRLWRVESLTNGEAVIVTPAGDEVETARVAVDDLVLVAEFRERIYPGLRPDGEVCRGGGRPFHTVINGENFHVLEQLTFTHENAVDAIYIDPPYNTGARDWKYNNDYVEGDDLYRHSKWLAFMERRLKIAKRLLKPEDSVLIVTIDEKEYLRLGLLLEQVFPEARVQMVSVGINPASVARSGYFGRSDEYAFYVMLGDFGIRALDLGADWITTKGRTHTGDVRWDLLRRSGSSPTREGHPDTFYPFFVTSDGKAFHSVGEPIGVGSSRFDTVPPPGTFAVWPIRQDGSEGRWGLQPSTVRKVLADGYLRLGKAKGEQTPIYYLASGERAKIQAGIYEVVGREQDGSVITAAVGETSRLTIPGSQWRIPSHDATQYGTRLLSNFIPGRRFPFPKSLFAVEDSLRFAVHSKPEAVVVDFFAGSGTTAHAVMRLNRQDGGERQCISVTNNEVSADEQARLRQAHLRPGDAGWEKWGICDYITKPRIRAAITGTTPEGEPVKGDYKFVDEFPMAEGFEENAAFFTLTYESPFMVSTDRAFAAIAPMLWLRAGARGERIDSIEGGWAVTEHYGILRDLDQAAEFIEALNEREQIRIAYVVTDDEGRYQQVASEVPHIETVRLYEDYLRNCESTGDF